MPLDAAKRRKADDLKEEARKRAEALQDEYAPTHLVKTKKIEIVDAADPLAPGRTIRRARRVCHYDELHRAGTLTDEQRHAADLYGRLAEVAEGARWSNGETLGRLPPWMQGHPGEHQRRAMGELVAARHAVGRQGADVLDHLILCNWPLKQLAAHFGTNPQMARGLVVGALQRLAEHVENRAFQKALDRR